MSIIIITRDRFKLEVCGFEEMARHIMKSRKLIEVQTTKNGRIVLINRRDILFVEVVSPEEESMLAAQAAAEKKKNPKQGRDPEFITPGGRR